MVKMMKMVKNVQLLQSCVVVKMVRKDKQGSGLLPAMIQDLTPIGLKRYTPEKKGGFSDGGLGRRLQKFDLNSEG